ncbi:lactococcin 972 family bacteriocin [Streptomyces bungoensis]|uniref:lactococcin 972 family bacteriocin n=1 Tax=Streptomyces bungoensis TaxID=285568 RepID=UPI001FC9206F|nr:lactococcin 972 family bacteriocin [Streptomyces bungoensis]
MSVIFAVFSFATPAAAGTSQAATVTANGTIVAADGSEVGHVTLHKRGDGTKPPTKLGNPSEWGAAVIKMGDSSATPKACVGASGGTWCYGYDLNTDGKYCYSNYYHPTKIHRSTVKIAGGSLTAGAYAGETSYAHLTAGAGYTCYTYYSLA